MKNELVVKDASLMEKLENYLRMGYEMYAENNEYLGKKEREDK